MSVELYGAHPFLALTVDGQPICFRCGCPEEHSIHNVEQADEMAGQVDHVMRLFDIVKDRAAQRGGTFEEAAAEIADLLRP